MTTGCFTALLKGPGISGATKPLAGFHENLSNNALATACRFPSCPKRSQNPRWGCSLRSATLVTQIRTAIASGHDTD
jgi:hypothetical protein